MPGLDAADRRQSEPAAGQPLLERDAEISALGQILDLTRAGRGQVVVIEGAPGIGKSALVQVARHLGAEHGFMTLSARGMPLESELPFGVVRQLFERMLARMPASRRAGLLEGAARLAAPILGLENTAASGSNDLPDQDVMEARFGALHGLYWLVANLAEGAPVLLAADDAQWSDLPSLQAVLYVARRAEDIPLAVLLVARGGEPGAAASLLSQFLAESPVQVLRPSPLSEAAVATLVGTTLPGSPDTEFCRACHRASGGNPFLVHELIGQLVREGITPSAAESWRLSQMRSAAVTGEVRARLTRLGTGPAQVAQATAILGADAQPNMLARLAGQSTESAVAALDRLIAAGLLNDGQPVDFTHPLVRDAIYHGIPPARRALLHYRAAQELAGRKAKPQSIAAHLVHARPAAEPWVVQTLHFAALIALREGAPEQAVTYLRRAMAETPGSAPRVAIITDLGRAAAAALDPEAIPDLKAALSMCSKPRMRAFLALTLARLLMHQGRLEEAIRTLEEDIARLSTVDRDLALRLEAELILSMQIHPELHSQSRWRMDHIDLRQEPDGIGKQLLMADLAGRAGFQGDPASHTAALAEAALADWPTLVNEAAGSGVVAGAIHALVWCDRLDQAEQILAALLPYALKRGSILTAVLLAPFRSDIAYRRGDIPDAVAYAREALAMATDHGMVADVCYALGFLIRALVEEGKLSAASQALGQLPIGGNISGQLHFHWLLYARGVLMSAKGDHAGALGEYLACGQRQLASGCLNPAVIPWRSGAALASAALRQQDRARQLATEELEAARSFGAPRAIGIALRIAGLTEHAPRSLELLAEAVSVLEHSSARLDLGRALIDYGAALRRSGRRGEARDPLRRGLDLATRCGASPLAERAHWELLAAGARPRRALLTGVDALTSTERRVAVMAADGMTNRQVAENMFISMKTVSVHLTHIYQKLGIATRSELATTLGATSPNALHGWQPETTRHCR
jgi:DNA-binding CsgD family transcriptional regulator